MLLGLPQGVFDLNNSNTSVGSYLLKKDVLEILRINCSDIEKLPFITVEGLEVIDERNLHKYWHNNSIGNTSFVKGTSLDELILLSLIQKSLPGCKVERQVRVGRFSMDFYIKYEGRELYVEFDGPSHFTVGRYGPPKHHPFRKKMIVEEKTGIEVVNWPFWIQRCEANVKALFTDEKGLGVLWSSSIHFSDFVFEDSATIIESINSRFNISNKENIGWFYEGGTKNRNNPEHPIIKKIQEGHEKIEKLLPKGWVEKEKWLPEKLY